MISHIILLIKMTWHDDIDSNIGGDIEPGPGVVVDVVVVAWRPADCWISNPYVLEVASLIEDLLVADSTPYLKIILEFVVPGAVAA